MYRHDLLDVLDSRDRPPVEHERLNSGVGLELGFRIRQFVAYDISLVATASVRSI